mgnify:CR=1 FL=1
MPQPTFTTIKVHADGDCLHVLLNRPHVRNAVNQAMVAELSLVFSTVAAEKNSRVIVLRGAEGNLCAGGDVGEMRAALAETTESDPLAESSCRFGRLLSQIDGASQAVVIVAEGTVMGGGLGLVCAADVVVACEDARFALPEATLGLVPAQIAPYLVRRIGESHTRRLAVTAARIGSAEALGLGLVHKICDSATLDSAVRAVIDDTLRCGPNALAKTKGLLSAVALVSEQEQARRAHVFAQSARSAEAQEGMQAFASKRPAHWVKGSRSGDNTDG